MKTLKTLLLMALVGVALFWTACKKEVSTSVIGQQQPQSNQPHYGGVRDDDPLRVAKVPLIMSSTFMTSSQMVSTERAPRPPKPIKSGPDVTPPTVSITSPTQGQTLNAAATTVTVSASDNVGVTSVSLSVNGTVLTTLSSSPYNFSWDATSYGGTTPTLTATAKDAAGNSNSVTITVAVNAPIVILPPPPPPGGGGTGGGTLPSSYLLSTPPVGNQGYEWSCVPFATAYAARSIEQYYRTHASSFSYSTNIFSPEYVYDQTKFTDCGSGTAITTTLDLMVNKGVCLWSTLPYDDMNGCDASIATPFDGQAANYKIASYGKLVNTDITGIKTMLVANHPIIASLAIDNSFLNAGPGFIWNTYSGSGGAGHTLIFCGYDDSKHAYKVMSSWGTGWGDSGYSWIDYDFFPTRAGYYVYVMNY
jgi:hypothetical protein